MGMWARCAVVSLLPMLACRSEASPPAGAIETGPPEVRIEPNSPKMAYISVDTVALRRDRVVATLPGQVVMNESRTVRVTSPVSGRITALDAQPGDHVQAGQPLAHIASTDVGQAESDLAKADAALAQAAASLKRARDLHLHQVIALKDLQQAESDEAQARAERDRARAKVQLLGGSPSVVTQEYVLRAPITGQVIERTANPGAEVRPDNQQPLFTLSALDTLWLVANAYQRDMGALRVGQRVVFTTDAAPGRRFVARISYVAAALDPQTRTITVRAVLPNPGESLKTQVFGEVRLFVPDMTQLPVVRTQALVTEGAEIVVFVQVAAGRFQRRVVTIDDDDGETAVIRSGLKPGDIVVTEGSILLATEAQQAR